MKSKKTLIGRVVSFSEGKAIDEYKIYDSSPLDENLSDDEFKRKYKLSKVEFIKATKKYSLDKDPDDLGCVSQLNPEENDTFSELDADRKKLAKKRKQ